MSRPILLLCSILLLLTGISQARAGAGKTLSASQIRAMFPGTYVGTYGKTPVNIKANSNGSLRGIAEGRHDQGRWSIVGNKLCVAWTVWGSGKTKCKTVVKRGHWYVTLKKSGKVKMKIRRASR